MKKAYIVICSIHPAFCFFFTQHWLEQLSNVYRHHYFELLGDAPLPALTQFFVTNTDAYTTLFIVFGLLCIVTPFVLNKLIKKEASLFIALGIYQLIILSTFIIILGAYMIGLAVPMFSLFYNLSSS